MKRVVLVLIALLVGLFVAEALLVRQDANVVREFERERGDGVVEYRSPTSLIVSVQRVPDRPRIVFMGASTVLGVPFRDRMSPAAWLQRLLDHWRVDAEVVALAHEASSSTDVRRWLGFALSLQPTVIVLLTGHNEYLSSERLLDDHWWHRYQLSSRLVGVLGLEPAGRLRTPTAAHPMPHARVAETYAENLRAMREACDDAGVPLLICVPTSNLAGCPPVLGEAASAAWRRARELTARGEHAAAHAEYVAARDLDAWPYRAPSTFGDIVRREAEHWVDLDQVFAEASDTGNPGDDLFIDHCHPNVVGQRLMALGVAEGLRAGGWLPFPEPLPEALGLEQGVEAFGLTGSDRRKGRRLADRMLLHLVIGGERKGALSALVRRRLEESRWRERDELSLALLSAIEGDAAGVRASVEQLTPEQRVSLQAYFDKNPRVADALRRCGLLVRGNAVVPAPRAKR